MASSHFPFRYIPVSKFHLPFKFLTLKPPTHLTIEAKSIVSMSPSGNTADALVDYDRLSIAQIIRLIAERSIEPSFRNALVILLRSDDQKRAQVAANDTSVSTAPDAASNETSISTAPETPGPASEEPATEAPIPGAKTELYIATKLSEGKGYDDLYRMEGNLCFEGVLMLEGMRLSLPLNNSANGGSGETTRWRPDKVPSRTPSMSSSHTSSSSSYGPFKPSTGSLEESLYIQSPSPSPSPSPSKRTSSPEHWLEIQSVPIRTSSPDRWLEIQAVRIRTPTPKPSFNMRSDSYIGVDPSTSQSVAVGNDDEDSEICDLIQGIRKMSI
ncbi:hypothetical protein SBOR_2285 [Sclerotinia borealis F-4128]|uniref:Uncharacterized protein n=1 Tax=Sclerotinia borealis (strain F-4128) TaxID=1432307 RepID=W9CKM1_SCLBF|nr:hypothetical protein SBOR_2285 [Sclerotinia borealis F-4128]